MKTNFIVAFLVLITWNCLAQDSTSVQPPQPVKPVEKEGFSMSLDLGFDYLKLVTLALPNEDKYEGLGAINFGFGLSLEGEYGYVKKSAEKVYQNGNYLFEGNYYRVGLSYNYRLTEGNIVGIGVRYAKSDFKDYTDFTIASRYYPDLFIISNPWQNHSAQWAEVVIKTEGSLKKVKNFKLGMFIRLKYLDPIKQNKDFPIHFIPGYGVAKANNTGAVNLYIKYSIPIIRN